MARPGVMIALLVADVALPAGRTPGVTRHIW